MNYTLIFTQSSYTIRAGDRSTKPQQCRYAAIPETEAALMTLIIGLGDLLVRIQRADKDPVNYGVTAVTDNRLILHRFNSVGAHTSPREEKLFQRALGMMRRFGEFGVENMAEDVIMIDN